MDTARLLPHALASPMFHLPAHNEALSNPHPHRPPNPHSVDLVRPAHVGQPEHIQNLKPHEIVASRNSDSSSSAHVCDDRNSADAPTQLQATQISVNSSSISNGNLRSLPQKREHWSVSDMDEYLAASRLCREEAMACSLLSAGVHWPFAERENRKKSKHKSLSLTCRVLNAGTNQSWRGLKKLLSKQFMPFSYRDHRGLHHINTTINKRSLKALNVGGRKMDARIQVGANKRDCVLSCKKLQGKENTEQNGNEIRVEGEELQVAARQAQIRWH